MNIVAIIPARAGSKRLKKKNRLKINNKPLIEWTIRFAKKLKFLSAILVSTDDLLISKIAKKNNVLCEGLRPKKLSNDKSKTVDVCIFEVNKLINKGINVDAILLLQPTSPFRLVKNINKAFKIFKKKKLKSLLSVTKMEFNEKTILERIKEKKHAYFFSKKKNLYKINGNFYLISVDELKDKKNFFSKNTYLFQTKTFKEAIDIDNKDDFILAKKYF